MAAVKWILCMVCMSVGIGISAPAQAQGLPYFIFRVCNQTAENIFVAILSRADAGSSAWRTHGWYTVTPGCLDLGGYPHGQFYFYGVTERGTYWGGNTMTACVAFPGPFDHTNEGNYQCQAGEQIRGFVEIYVGPEYGSYVTTLQ
ncbi:MAG: hypothetical protein QOI12_3836 [Alphaproteobacteria bacterium]|nr:hypothetical protein [Alphaproteobacteria bacterium]